MTQAGHNSGDDRLRLLIERVERLEEEKKGIADDIRDTYAEAKAVGYDSKIMRQIVRLRKMKPDDRAEMEAILDTYKAALGMLNGTPLGSASLKRATDDYCKHLSEMDDKGIGISMAVGDGPHVPLNRTAAEKMETSK
jgi:uncharacterized protein (UPF0335 family)